MGDERFEIFFDALYSAIPLIRKQFLTDHGGTERGTITKAHFPLLLTVYARTSITMTEAARSIGISKPHMTMQVERLVEEGLIERVADPDDRRLVSVRLTAKGGQFVTNLRDRMRERAEKVFASVPSEDRAELLRALLTIGEVLKKAEHGERREGDVEQSPGRGSESPRGKEK